ncbi:MAG TPA: MlaD family protein [Solirubrobacterales bacterium]|jgi:ABC-type transporter Mla subunit MlaD|nr:MlaD family protein [Solirubrobacterales bacterium]
MIKRAIPALLLVAAVVVVVLLVSGGGSSGSGYVVRAIFDNGGFMVNGEQVRVAGANVGEIKAVNVTMPGDVVAYRDGEPVSVPGKAVIEMEITDPGFQDFRQDATCQIRPQSLIGEKFVDCRPTLPRAPGTEPPPALKQIPDGETGAGQYLLPLGNSGTSVDPDLINDIQTLPYAQRFRLIFNELGAGFAGRGEDLEVLVKRANPVLRDVDTLFGILSDQRDELAQLASDSDAILGPLARERRHVAGFISNAGAAAEASSERGEQLEESLQKFPTFLREFRTTMTNLQGFSDAATPVMEDLGAAAPSLTDATRTLTPFSEATTVALKSLGEAGEASGPFFAEADPIVRKTTELSKSGVKPTKELAKLTTSIRKTGGWDSLVELIYNTSLATNGFDKFGHYGRTFVSLSNCIEYEANAEGSSGCNSNFNGENAGNISSTSTADLFRLLQQQLDDKTGGTSPTGIAGGPSTGLGQADETESEPDVGSASATEGTEPLLDYLLGP